MNILLATDVFPPRCGGSGWSTYYLARGLRDRGHVVTVVRGSTSVRNSSADHYDDFQVEKIVVPTIPLPMVRNISKNELFWSLAAARLEVIARRDRVDVIHGQHVMSIPPAIRAARRLGIPGVATVRDYWPTCPIGTRFRPDGICPSCSVSRLTECLAHHDSRRYRIVRLLQGYVEANRRRRQNALRAATHVIAVSTYIAQDLAKHGGIEATVIHNMIDVPTTPVPPPPEMSFGDVPPVVFVGKLDHHKGADRLPAIMQQAQVAAELIAVGEGPLRQSLEEECCERGIRLRVFSDLPNSAVLAWLAHASAVVTPARWPEPLSRVWLEAASVGCPIVSTPVGGAADAIVHGQTGYLEDTDELMGDRLRQLIGNPDMRRRMGEAARQLARTRFATPAILDQMEALYASAVIRS